ncbi:MAG TPA: MFS transporter, partial [Candidatus Dormibacteraeota bacterium]|jgi:MFS family permease|nr:MFS transporter [Candidatus Dormibacteraeota bacterium]
MVALGPVDANYAINLLAPMVLLGLGGGLSFPALTMIAMADVAPSDAGLASGLLNTTGQVGGAFGLAVMATVATARSLELMQQGAGVVAGLAGGFHLAWLVGAAVVVVTLAVSALMLRERSRLEFKTDALENEAAA